LEAVNLTLAEKRMVLKMPEIGFGSLWLVKQVLRHAPAVIVGCHTYVSILISALEGTQQGLSRRSPRRSRPRELGHYKIKRQPYGRTRQPEGWVREFPHTPNSFSVTNRHSAGGLGRRRRRWPALSTSHPATLTQTSEVLRGQVPG
jgi:hypothetical protein